MSLPRLIELNYRFACLQRKAILPAILLVWLIGVGTVRGEQWEKVADAARESTRKAEMRKKEMLSAAFRNAQIIKAQYQQ